MPPGITNLLLCIEVVDIYVQTRSLFVLFKYDKHNTDFFKVTSWIIWIFENLSHRGCTYCPPYSFLIDSQKSIVDDNTFFQDKKYTRFFYIIKRSNGQKNVTFDTTCHNDPRIDREKKYNIINYNHNITEEIKTLCHV